PCAPLSLHDALPIWGFQLDPGRGGERAELADRLHHRWTSFVSSNRRRRTGRPCDTISEARRQLSQMTRLSRLQGRMGIREIRELDGKSTRLTSSHEW